MIPEGLEPKMHRMYITPAVYEPTTSAPHSKERRFRALHHKSLLFSFGNDAKQTNSSGDWFLTEEEYEVWNRLYRLNENDGIKTPIMPQFYFETLEEK
uniref:Fanconi anemia group M protein MHF binding domain-containing protein n=1 Tax=Sphenodon punctatus TaxID=8508 RepID=A0A8D0L3S1_SPHPU